MPSKDVKQRAMKMLVSQLRGERAAPRTTKVEVEGRIVSPTNDEDEDDEKTDTDD